VAKIDTRVLIASPAAWPVESVAKALNFRECVRFTRRYEMSEGSGSTVVSIMESEPPRDAFLSYASHDAAIADSVVRGLERAGMACWIAPRDVPPGAQYADAIVRAINSAKVLILVLSESAVGSAHVGKEIERASAKGRPIIALRIDAAPLTPALEYFLSESQWIEARSGATDAALPKLIDAVRRLLTAAPCFRISYRSAFDHGERRRKV
jgi:hypothetical protein